MRLQRYLASALTLVCCTVAFPSAHASVPNTSDCNPMCGGSIVLNNGSGDTTYVYSGCAKSLVGADRIHILGSSSGQAHNAGAGFTIQLFDENNQDIREWTPTDCGAIGGDSEFWLFFEGSGEFSDGTGKLQCGDPNVSSALTVPYYEETLTGSPITVHPTFGGAGPIIIQVKTGEGDYITVANLFDGRSTDTDADGDTDEADEAEMRAAITAGTDMDFDLNWDTYLNESDLAILLTEARLHVSGALCSDGYTTTGTTHDPVPYPTERNAQYPPATTTDLSVERIDASTVRLTWTAPADDGSSGRNATAYAVRRSNSAISSTSAFNLATVVTAPPTPGSPGGTVTMDVALAVGTSAYFAVRTKDDADNWSAVSNSPQSANVAPAAVADLGGTTGRYSAKLNWTAPGEDADMGTATAYAVRYKTGSTFTESDWASATDASVGFSPGVAGSSECLVVSDLTTCTQYSFAMKTMDAASQWSSISNKVTVTTKCSGSLTLECGGGMSSRPAVEEPQSLALALGDLLPNPTRAGGVLSYSIPRTHEGEAIDLSIFDVSGRRAVTLATGSAVSGLHTVQWDGHSEASQRLGPGVYFVHMQVGPTKLTRAIQILP